MGYKKSPYRRSLRALFILIYLGLFYTLIQHESIPELTSNAPIQFFANGAGDDLKKVAKEAIQRARSSITLVVYSLTDSGMIELLNRRAAEGIHILIVHDKNATPDIQFRLHERIRCAPYKNKGLMHYKLLVIDKAQVWFGSTNFSRDSFTLHANQMLGVFSEEFAAACEEKALEMYRGHRFKASPLIVRTPLQSMDFFFLPENNQALDKLIQTIKTAKKSCRVAMYTFTHPLLQTALIEAKRRGVAVEVILDRESSQQTSRQTYERLKREKVPVFRSRHSGLLHHKMMIVDDMLVTGSANWTKAAFQSNDDCIAFIAPLTTEQSTKLEELWKNMRQEAGNRS